MLKIKPPRKRSVFQYFLQCYWKHLSNRKGQSLKDVARLWLKLSENERKYFKKRLEENEEENSKKYAEYLSKLEPFLKKKNFEDNREDALVIEKSKTFEESNLEHQAFERDDEEENQSTLENHLEHQDIEMQNEGTIEEPEPPPIDSKELFFKINLQFMGQKECLEAWADRRLKTHYCKAVNLLKRDYIRKYSEYLNSLSSFELYELLKEKKLVLGVPIL